MQAARPMAVLLLTLTLIASMGLSAASSSLEEAPPTLGMRVTSEVYASDPSPSLLLASRASHPTRVEMTLPQGWTMETSTLDLDPLETVTMPFLTVGPTSEMTSRQTLLDPTTGGTQGALEIATQLRSERPTPPMDWTPYAMTLALVLTFLGLALLTVRWVLRNVQVSRR